jgi:hypothetical protein
MGIRRSCRGPCWRRGRALRLVAGRQDGVTECHTPVTPTSEKWRARQGSNLWPSAPEARKPDANSRFISYLPWLPRAFGQMADALCPASTSR